MNRKFTACIREATRNGVRHRLTYAVKFEYSDYMYQEMNDEINKFKDWCRSEYGTEIVTSFYDPPILTDTHTWSFSGGMSDIRYFTFHFHTAEQRAQFILSCL